MIFTIGHLPSHTELSAYLKNHERYADLHSQSSQRVIQELDEAYKSWQGHLRDGNSRMNPPGYRKKGDRHPRSTVTFKQKGFRHDAENRRVRLSKGCNLKTSRCDFILCDYSIDPDVSIQEVQQVRAVYDRDEWHLHLVCREYIDPDPPGDGVAGLDLGIANIAAVSFGNEGVLYPGGALKEDENWFEKETAKCDDSTSIKSQRLYQRRSDRRTHYLHTISKDIVKLCVEQGVAAIVVGELSGVRNEPVTGDPRNLGPIGNHHLHGWAFDRFTSMLEYQAEERGIVLERVDEYCTSVTCSACGLRDENQRIERGLYVCEECDTVSNADINGAENIRQKVLPSLPPDGGDRDNGWMAQPRVRLFARDKGQFAPREQVVDSKP
jgi:putative transposase